MISSNAERYTFTVEEAMSHGFRRARRWQGDYTRNYTKLSAPTSPPPPIEENFNPETIALMQQIRNLETRIKALETQPTFACG